VTSGRKRKGQGFGPRDSEIGKKTETSSMTGAWKWAEGVGARLLIFATQQQFIHTRGYLNINMFITACYYVVISNIRIIDK
jgi:hypothetical protein